MDCEGIKLWVDIAQIATAILTLIGIYGSMHLSIKAIREVEKDRKYSQRPYLLFDMGGHIMGIELKKDFKTGKYYAAIKWDELPGGFVSVHFYGKLKNYGTGPAFDIHITWLVNRIWIKDEMFEIDNEKLKQAQYNPKFNTNPVVPKHLVANQETGLHLMPTFIADDFDRKISKAEGVHILTYKDSFGEKYTTRQKFYVFTDYQHPENGFHVTFSDIVEEKIQWTWQS
jgi:hypothetical protein